MCAAPKFNTWTLEKLARASAITFEQLTEIFRHAILVKTLNLPLSSL